MFVHYVHNYNVICCIHESINIRYSTTQHLLNNMYSPLKQPVQSIFITLVLYLYVMYLMLNKLHVASYLSNCSYSRGTDNKTLDIRYFRDFEQNNESAVKQEVVNNRTKGCE